MAGILSRLTGVGETALDYLTPDSVFGNVGKLGARKAQPYIGTSMMQALFGGQPTAPGADDIARAQHAAGGLDVTRPFVAPPGDGATGPDDPSIQPYGQPSIMNVPTAAAPAVPQAGGSSGFGQGFKNGLGILDRVLGGQTITGAMESQRQAQQARADEPANQAEREKTKGMLDALVKSGEITPTEALLARTDPTAFGKVIEARSKPEVVGDSSSIFANGRFAQAPAAPVKPQKPEVISGKDGLYLFDPLTRKATKLSSWAAYAPHVAAKGKVGGSADAPPSGFKLD